MGQTRLTSTDYISQWPDFLQAAAKQATKLDLSATEPRVVRMHGSELSRKQFKDLIGTANITEIVDNYDEQLAELFISDNAQLYKANAEVKSSSIAGYLKDHYSKTKPWEKGTWVHYPWSGRLVHLLEEELFTKLRTLRNQFLITPEEQKTFAAYRVGCAGMSVGSNGAIAIALTGGSHKIKLADGAVISGSNLNRLRAVVADIGLNKAEVIARQLYEMNPYLEIDITPNNLDQSNIETFFSKPWPIDLIVDEIDDLEMKVRLRMEAKKRRIPLIMATEPGDDAMLDVERYDLDPNLPLFHGLAGDIEQVLSKGKISQREFVKYAVAIIGVKNLSLRAQHAMLKVGATMPSPPQLGSTAMFTGAIIAYAARQLAIGGSLKSGRHLLALDKPLTTEVNTLAYKLEHRRNSAELVRAMKSM
jgi:hypothetical protein